METLSLFKSISCSTLETTPTVSVEQRILDFHKTHDITKGEFYNTTLDLALKVETGHFAKNPEGLAICRFAPTWFYGPVWTALAPSIELLEAYKANKISKEEYCKVFYRETLSKLDAKEAYEELKKRGFPTLLCFERQGLFCHRHLVQEWLFLNN